MDRLVNTLADADAHARALLAGQEDLAARVRTLEKMLDTRATPLWRRILFRLDGWPSWATVAVRPAWRPWRRWWVS